MKILKELLTIEKKPKKGLLAIEWTAFGYLLLTLLIILFCYTKVQNPHAMITGRIQIAVTTLLMWAVYRMLPCRLVMLIRVIVQMSFLSWWYPDTYEINRMLPNLDHVFASWEQQLFGCQPALLFSQAFTHPVFSELMDLGYASYYPMIAAVAIFFFFARYKDFHQCVFIIMASFFVFYVIFILVPVTGPMFYYQAVGVDEIAKGVFPNVGDYFYFHQDCLPSPGWKDGFFYHLVESAHEAGERPTAAFPSPFLACRHRYRLAMACLAGTFPLAVLHLASSFHPDVLCHGLYSGPLRHRRLGRPPHRNRLLLAFPMVLRKVLLDEGLKMKD